jgi:hypothetical protein
MSGDKLLDNCHTIIIINVGPTPTQYPSMEDVMKPNETADVERIKARERLTAENAMLRAQRDELLAALRVSDDELMRLREMLKGEACAYVDRLHIQNSAALAKAGA